MGARWASPSQNLRQDQLGCTVSLGPNARVANAMRHDLQATLIEGSILQGHHEGKNVCIAYLFPDFLPDNTGHLNATVSK